MNVTKSHLRSMMANFSISRKFFRCASAQIYTQKFSLFHFSISCPKSPRFFWIIFSHIIHNNYSPPSQLPRYFSLIHHLNEPITLKFLEWQELKQNSRRTRFCLKVSNDSSENFFLCWIHPLLSNFQRPNFH